MLDDDSDELGRIPRASGARARGLRGAIPPRLTGATPVDLFEVHGLYAVSHGFEQGCDAEVLGCSENPLAGAYVLALSLTS